MRAVRCPQCKFPIEISIERKGGFKGIKALVFLTCIRCDCSWAIEVEDNELISVQSVRGADALSKGVPTGIVADIREAERAYYACCYRACVVMCRRALQLALEVRGAQGRTLGPILEDVRENHPKLLDAASLTLAEGIKSYGDDGAHAAKDIVEHEAEIVLGVSVNLLNELFPQPVLPSKTDHNESLPF